MMTISVSELTPEIKSKAARVDINGDSAVVYFEDDNQAVNIVENVSTARYISVREFSNRFTNIEMSSAIIAGYYDSKDVNVAMLLLKLQTASEINLNDAEVVNGLRYLESVNILSPGRIDEILK